MKEELIQKPKRPVLLTASTQIEILQLLEKGKTYKEIDNMLEVPLGSSEYTINVNRRG